MSFVILGLGTALPEHCISQQGAATFATTCIAADAAESSNVPALVQALYRRAGVHQRHSVLLESSSDGEATAERFYEFAKSLKIVVQPHRNACSVMKKKRGRWWSLRPEKL